MEHPKRSLIKTATWRIIALTITVLVVYAYSHDIQKSLAIGISANFLKMILYYIHERVWNKIKFGKIRSPEYEI